MIRRHPIYTLFPYTTLFRSSVLEIEVVKDVENSYLTRLWNNPVFHGERTNKGISDIVSQYFTLAIVLLAVVAGIVWMRIDSSKADRKSTRLNSSHVKISYAV